MRKIKYILFALIITLIIPTVLAKENVEIKSIEMVDKSEYTTIKSEPTFKGLEMNYDIAFKQPTDFVKFKVIIQNNTNINYKISDDTSFNNSEYINYKYEVNDELKANGESIVFVTITYNKVIDKSKLVDNVYHETNRAVVKILNEKNEIVNPNTGLSIFVVIILVSIITFALLLFKIKSDSIMKNISLLFILGIMIIPTIVFAVDALKLTINVNVEIKDIYKVGYYFRSNTLIPENEFNNIETTLDSECKITYIGSDKYYYCKKFVLRDIDLYLSGEQVQLKSLNYTKFSMSGFRSCSISQNNELICPSDAETISYTFDGWKYSIENTILDYIALGPDKEIMNFEYYLNDSWDSLKSFEVKAPQSFTMPSHNVLFFPPPVMY